MKLLPRVQEFLRLVCQYHNHFISQRLCTGTKTLPNGKHRKVYEKISLTPYKRILANEKVSKEIKEKLKVEHEKLNPKTLHDELTKMKCDILTVNRLQTGEILFH